MTFAFAAAGTGGHVYPALAVADELVARGVAEEDIVFVGGDRMEARVVPDHGYRFHGVEIRGLRRALTKANLTLPTVVWRAAVELSSEFRRLETRIVTVFGGYVSVPAAWAARRVGARIFVHEQNAVPGLANRIVARRAAASFVAFPSAAARLPRARVVGNPLRPELAAFDRDALRGEARRRYELDEDLVVLGVLGGSLGAKVLNDVVERVADAMDEEPVGIVHLTGLDHHDEVARRAASSHLPWRTKPFEDRMDLFYAAADVVLSRAGALTVSELAATGTPAVIVPLDAVAQAPNAMALASAGGAIVVEQGAIDRVPVEVEQLLSNETRRKAMGVAAAGLGRPDAAAAIADDLLEAAGE